jgi:hypothetical protein
MSGPRLYRGDIAYVALGPARAKCIIREVIGDRAKVQLEDDWTWLFTEELTWIGDCLTKLPRTERGWRKFGRLYTKA